MDGGTPDYWMWDLGADGSRWIEYRRAAFENATSKGLLLRNLQDFVLKALNIVSPSQLEAWDPRNIEDFLLSWTASG